MAYTYNLNRFIEIAESWGLTDVMLPFLLIFTIIFAIMQKTNILGEGKKNFNVVIALVMALMVVIPHVTNSYPSSFDAVDIINSSLPGVSLVAVAVIMMLILVGLFGGEARWLGGSLSGWIAIASFGIIVLIFGGAAGWWGNRWYWFENFFDSDAVALIIIILVFGVIIWFITKPDNKEEGIARTAGIFDQLGNMFKPK